VENGTSEEFRYIFGARRNRYVDEVFHQQYLPYRFGKFLFELCRAVESHGFCTVSKLLLTWGWSCYSTFHKSLDVVWPAMCFIEPCRELQGCGAWRMKRLKSLTTFLVPGEIDVWTRCSVCSTCLWFWQIPSWPHTRFRSLIYPARQFKSLRGLLRCLQI